MKYLNKLPIYEVHLDENDDIQRMTCISIVDDPAIEVDFQCFNKESKFTKDEMQHIITGPAIIADLPIYRFDYELGEYYVVFNKETIKKIVEKYSKDNLFNFVSLEHNGQLLNSKDIVMVEFFIKDSSKGIIPQGFEDVADGSLFVSYKVYNDELWNNILNSTNLNGFSIEITSELKPITLNKQTKEEDVDKVLEDIINGKIQL